MQIFHPFPYINQNSAFGCALKEREFSGEKYRYGFNGQEKQTEITNSSSHYTAEFWMYDSRLGRRWNLDPKPTISISDYSTFGNNPIILIDPNGDKFENEKHKNKLVKKTEKRKKEIEKNITGIQEKIKSLNSEIDVMQKKLDGEKSGSSIADNINSEIKNKTNQISELNTGLDEQNFMLGEMTNSLREIDDMTKSDQLFITKRNILRGNKGYTEMRTEDIDQPIVIRFGTYASASHEFLHGFQFLNGEMSFPKKGETGDGVYDLIDEQKSYWRDYSFNPKMNSYTKVTNHNQITTDKYSSLPSYQGLKNENLNIDNYKGSLKNHIVVSPKNRVK